jgi:hypothetical protein
MVVSMVRTTLPKKDKVGTLSVKAPTAQTLVARLGSKAPDDNLADDDPDLLNFDMAESEIACRTSSRLQRCWLDSGKLDCLVWYLDGPVFTPPDASPAFLVLGHEDVKGGLWAALQLPPPHSFAISHPSDFFA